MKKTDSHESNNTTTNTTKKVLIKDAKLSPDLWHHIASEDVGIGIDIDRNSHTENNVYKLITLEQWQQDREALLAGKWALGVSLAGESDIYDTGLLPYLQELQLIAIDFSLFTDGRGFSLAAQLRQHGFNHELRATGAIIVDQLHYLQRCGFNAFELNATEDIDVALNALTIFSNSYQKGW